MRLAQHRCRKKRRARIAGRSFNSDTFSLVHAFRTAHKNKQRQNIKQGALYVGLFIFPISGTAERIQKYLHERSGLTLQPRPSGSTIAILSKYIPAICVEINASGLPHRELEKFSTIP